MATRKQRRREEKLRRHEWEYETTTEEGEVVRAASLKELTGDGSATASRGSGTGTKVVKGRKEPDDVVRDARGKIVPKPSWQRTLKRAAIFGPILVVLILVTGRQMSTTAKILNILVLLAIFIPFSHLVDRVVYRSVLKRQTRKREQAKATAKTSTRTSARGPKTKR
ncbi:MAG: hypothetical protein R3C15_07080 [Thermoleophilia bacterium]